MRLLYSSLITLSAAIFTTQFALAQEQIQAQAPNDSTTINAQAPAESSSGASCASKHHRAHHHHGGGPLQAIKSLPSLTPEQSKQLDEMMQSFQSDIKPLRQEAKALHEKLKEGGDNAQATARLQEIRGQFREGRKALMQKALGILTPDQKKELGAQRKPAQAVPGPTT